MIKELSPQEFLERRAAGGEMTLVDVREDWEVLLAPAPATLVHIPMGVLSARLSELEASRDTVVLCRSGGRSLQVARYLESQGFTSVFNLRGGILAWSRDVDPSIPEY